MTAGLSAYYPLPCAEKLHTVTKGNEVITYDYDGSLITSETLTGTLNQTLGYAYNSDFDVRSFTYAGSTVNYTYDNDGLLTGAGDFAISRNAQNGLPESVAGGPLSLIRTFSGYGETEAQNASVGGQGIVSWNVIRDDNGRITQKTESVKGVTATYGYEYDSVGRLLTVTRDGVLTEEYRYDPDGTRNYEMNALRGIAGRSLTYSDEDHLMTAGDISYLHDADGFLTTKTEGSDITIYDYSLRGELLSVTLPDGTVIEYVHDPLGRRIAKKVNGMITEKYLWHGMTRLLAVYDSSDSLVMRFEYADARMPVAMTAGGVTYYLAYDQVGSLKAVADASGNMVKKIAYDSFGNVISDSNPSFAVPFGFAGGLHDRDTGLVRFGYRDYDPDTGRWTAKDPIGFAGGDSDLYGYCVGDPVNLTDSKGLFRSNGSQAKINGRWVEGKHSGCGIYVYTEGDTTYAWNIESPDLNLPEIPTIKIYEPDFRFDDSDFLKQPPEISNEAEDFQKKWDNYIEDLESICP